MFRSWMWKQRSFREQFQGDEGGSAGGAGNASGAQGAAADDDQQAEQQEQQPEGEQVDAGGAEASPDAEAAAEDEGVVITLGDEPAANDDDEQFRAAPAWVKDLRIRDRDKAKRIRELEQKLAGGQQAQQPQAVSVGEKPTLESCDWDAEKFEKDLTAWHDRKRQADEQAAATRREQEVAQASWQKKLDGYKASGAALKVPDFEDAEAVVLDTLSQTQQAILVSGADNPAALVYALGKNPAEAKKLAAIKDPVAYAFAAAKLETKLKVQPRKSPPPAERQVRGNAGGATGIDNTEARLEAEADRTGDRSKLIAYRREKRRAAA